MLLINFTTAWRNLHRHSFSSFINIAGLAIGITCCMFIALYVWSELRADEFHLNSKNIFRVNQLEVENGRGGSSTPYPLGTALQNEFPDVKKITRFGQDNVSIRANNDAFFYEDGFYWADSTVFDVFSFEFVKGDRATALKDPYSLVMTESMAKKYFQDQDPIGKLVDLKVYDGNRNFTLTVTGVIQDIPENSSIRFSFLAPMTAGMQVYKQFENMWGLHWVSTYALTNDPSALAARADQSEAFYQKYTGGQTNLKLEFQPLSRVHLYSGHIGKNASDAVINVYLFATIGTLIFLLACVNFVNIATARAELRKKEVGVRKALGAFRKQLFIQFMTESLLTASIVLVISAVVTTSFLTAVSRYMNVSIPQLSLVALGLMGIAVLTVTGIFAGLYPALFLSGFRPLEALKPKADAATGGFSARQVLVVFQFTISIALISGTLLIGKQIRYLKSADLGFAPDQLITIPVDDRNLQKKIGSVKELLANSPGVVGAAATGETFPAQMNNLWSVTWQGLAEDRAPNIYVVSVDADYFKLLRASFIEGRDFSENFMTDDSTSVVINKAARDMMGANGETGSAITLDRQRTIIGVVDDIHHFSLHQGVAPIAYFPVPVGSRACSDNLVLKVTAGTLPETLASLKKKWNTFTQDRPFEYQFVDEGFAQAYAKEEKFLVLFEVFSGLAIAIACLGLMGLSSFVVNKRSKEIGIRKVLGASVPQILIMLTRGFSVPILVAFLISAPITYQVISTWLNKFAYRIDVDIVLITLAGVVAWLIAFLFIGYQSWKAARINPVKILKDE